MTLVKFHNKIKLDGIAISVLEAFSLSDAPTKNK